MGGLWGLVVWVAVGSAGAQERATEPAPVRDDAALESEIELRFTEDERLFGRGLDARVKQGTVVLTGTVKAREDLLHAERLARAAGVSAIDNQLAIEPPAAVEKSKPSNEPMTNEEREKRRRAREAARAEEPSWVERLPPPPTTTMQTAARDPGLVSASAVESQPAPPVPAPAPAPPPPGPSAVPPAPAPPLPSAFSNPASE